jgi:hypothetical protein
MTLGTSREAHLRSTPDDDNEVPLDCTILVRDREGKLRGQDQARHPM